MHKLTVIVFAIAASILVLGAMTCQAKPVAKKSKSPQAAPVSAPQLAAKSWLALTDSGKYAGSWQAASPTFQAQVTQSQWANAAQSVRDPLGKVQKRTLKRGQHTSSLPGAPAGDYAVLAYNTDFAKKRAATETVILTHDTDGKWRVSGYFVK